MYKISKIISNLHDNGEVNLFLLSGEITLNGYIINITADSDGNLKITKRIPCYNVKYFMARLEYAKERVIKLLYLILTKKLYKGKVFSLFRLNLVKI